MLRGLLITLLSLLAAPASAGVNDVIVGKAWLHETVQGQRNVNVMLDLSVLKPARVLGISSPVARGGEIRRFVRVHGKMEKQAVDSIQLRARSTVSFGMRNVYLVLTGLQQQINEGEHVALKLEVEIGGRVQTLDVQAEVRAADLSYQDL